MDDQGQRSAGLCGMEDDEGGGGDDDHDEGDSCPTSGEGGGGVYVCPVRSPFSIRFEWTAMKIAEGHADIKLMMMMMMMHKPLL